MKWFELAIGIAYVLGTTALIAKSLNSHPKEEKSRCRFIPEDEIVGRKYEEGMVEIVKGPAYECYIKEE